LTLAIRDDLDRWLTSAPRQDVLARMQPLIVGDRTVNVVGGFAGWFTAGPVAPRRWRRALAVFLGLVPVSLLVALVRTALLPHAPLPVGVVLGAAANVVLLTWFVMPTVTRRLEPWLMR
jgi:antibiotic biosynthesis monooxygenase (ABM) superfamily enzyme